MIEAPRAQTVPEPPGTCEAFEFCPPSHGNRARVDPLIDLLAEIRSDPPAPPSVLDAMAGPDGLEVLFDFSQPPGDRARRRLKTLGIELASTPGDGPSLGGVYAGFVPWTAVDRLETIPGLERAETACRPGKTAPLEVTTETVGAAAAHRRPGGPRGRGVTIALIDSPVDVAHPAFFRPDAGLVRWIDVDENGHFDPGIDAADIDGDGRPERNETLKLMEGVSVLDGSAEDLSGEDGRFDPTRDWLYADLNGDGERNIGAEAGFVESDPGYGEPTFVADDVDGDGRLDPDEALVQLGTSKIAEATTADATYLRGDSLIDAVDVPLPDRALHGTGVAGILVGGQTHVHDRTGMAPRADLLVFGQGRPDLENSRAHLRALRAAVDGGADVVLHEWTNPFFRPLDGSSNLAAALDAARSDGIVQVVPVGNLNESGKNVVRRIDAGSSESLGIAVPTSVERRDESRRVHEIFGTLQWNADTAVSLKVGGPDTPVRPMPFSDSTASIEVGGATVRATVETTDRGTRYLSFVITERTADAALKAGTWPFEVRPKGGAITVVGRVSDRHTGWRRGVGWTEPTADRMTVSYPATADGAVGVGAFVGRRTAEGPPTGTLRAFSGRGPRIDGAAVVDVTAPDNPFVPLAATSAVRQAGGGPSWYFQFGGTSGAAPHVAGAFALLAQAFPARGPAELEDALFESVVTDDLLPPPKQLPAPGWGRGKVSVYRALWDEPAPEGQPPTANLEVRRETGHWLLDASGSVAPDERPLQFRFDVGYDGRWETDWGDAPTLEVPFATAPVRRAKLLVRDPEGRIDGRLASLPPPKGGAEPPPASGDAGADTGDAGPADHRRSPPPGAGCQCRSVPSGPTKGPGRIHWLVLLLGWMYRRRRQTDDRDASRL